MSARFTLLNAQFAFAGRLRLDIRSQTLMSDYYSLLKYRRTKSSQGFDRQS